MALFDGQMGKAILDSGLMESNMVLEDMPQGKVTLEMGNGNEVKESDGSIKINSIRDWQINYEIYIKYI